MCLPCRCPPARDSGHLQRSASTTVEGAWTGCFHRNPPWPLQGHIKSHENESRSGRRPPDKGGWGVARLPWAGLVPALWTPAGTGQRAPTRGAPYDGWGIWTGCFHSKQSWFVAPAGACLRLDPGPGSRRFCGVEGRWIPACAGMTLCGHWTVCFGNCRGPSLIRNGARGKDNRHRGDW